jgi:hypothetical protein
MTGPEGASASATGLWLHNKTRQQVKGSIVVKYRACVVWPARNSRYGALPRGAVRDSGESRLMYDQVVQGSRHTQWAVGGRGQSVVWQGFIAKCMALLHSLLHYVQ